MVAILWKCISRAGRKMRWLTSKNSKGSKVSETLRSKEGIWKTDRVCKIVIWWCWQIWSTHSVRMWRTANIESRSRCYRTHEETKSRSQIVSLLKNKSNWWKKHSSDTSITAWRAVANRELLLSWGGYCISCPSPRQHKKRLPTPKKEKLIYSPKDEKKKMSFFTL